MTEKANPPRPNPWLPNRRLRDLTTAIRVQTIVDRIWQTMFTEAERQRISANDTMGPDIVDIWAKFKGVSPERAVVDLARTVDLISEAESQRLLQSLGEEVSTAKTSTLPVWDRSVGELRFEGQVVKEIRRLKAAVNVMRILDAFEEEGWPRRIDDPLSLEKGRQQSAAQRLQEAAKSLNDGLTLIRFRTDGTGEGIKWERV